MADSNTHTHKSASLFHYDTIYTQWLPLLIDDTSDTQQLPWKSTMQRLWPSRLYTLFDTTVVWWCDVCHARQAADVLWTEATRVSRSSVLTINCHAMQAANVLWSHKGQWVWHSHHQLPCNAGSKCSLKPQGSVGLAFSLHHCYIGFSCTAVRER